MKTSRLTMKSQRYGLGQIREAGSSIIADLLYRRSTRFTSEMGGQRVGLTKILVGTNSSSIWRTLVVDLEGIDN